MKLKAHQITVKYAGSDLTLVLVTDNKLRILLPINEFILDQAISGVGINTQKAYAADLISFFSLLFKQSEVLSIIPRDFRDVNEQHINIYLNQLEKKGLTVSTILRHIASLKIFYEAAYRLGYLKYPKVFSFGKYLRHRRHQDKSTTNIISQYIDWADFENICSCVTGSSSFTRARNELALLLGYELGLRTHELNNYSNFSLESLRQQLTQGNLVGYLSIRGKGNKQRTIPVSVKVVRKLNKFLYGEFSSKVTRFIFENHEPIEFKDNSFATNLFKDARNKFLAENEVSKSVFNTYKHWTFHSLRHTCATNWVTKCCENSWPPEVTVMEWMGHSHLSTTKRYIDAEALMKNRLASFMNESKNSSQEASIQV